MSLQKPKYHTPSAAESQQYVDSDSKFVTLKDGESAILRFLPAPVEYPSIFVPVSNHHGLLTQDGNKIALACLAKHGNAGTGSKCLLCEAAAALKATADNPKAPAAKMADEFRQKGPRFYTQVLRALTRRKETGKGVEIYGWTSSKFHQMSGTTQGKVQAIMNSMESEGEDLFMDPVLGQGIKLTRTGSGFDTEYMVERTGAIANLDDIRPDWLDGFVTDIYGALKLNVVGRDMQLAYLKVTFPGTDFESLLNPTSEEVDG